MAGMYDDAPSRPLSIKEISKQADEFHWNDALPLKAWIRTAKTLEQQASIYLREGNFPKAYLIYLRYSILALDKLQKHPEYKTPEGKKAYKQSITKTLPNVIVNLEKIRPLIERDYEEWKSSEARRQEIAQENASRSQSSYDKHASRDPTLSGRNRRLLDAREHSELAVDLAQREMRRRDADRRATRQAGVSAEEEQQRRTAGFWDNWTEELADRQEKDEEYFRNQMETTRKRLDGNHDDHISDFVQRMSRADRDRDRPEVPSRLSSSTAYEYPTISKSQPIQYESLQPQKLRKEPPAPKPPRPPKDFMIHEYREQPPIPELPPKESVYPTPETSQDRPEPPPKGSEILAPSAATKAQQRLTFRPAAYLENGEPLRSIFLPSQLRPSFLKLAQDHTARGVEMCGLLCGTAVNNALFISCLLIPEQNCTTDTCEMINESDMFDYCISEDLLVLGWIHTHPTQTCFMSSRDLHTQSGYQAMLPESVAIVCAPRFDPSFGIFRLTNPPGLPHILQCNQTATFHQHSVDDLYTGAGRPSGHVMESDRLEFRVKDLRPS